MEGADNLINFCDPIFEAFVESSSVCSDGFEATNLVSPNLDKRQKGFMADRFIKPPVEITIRFPCEISVGYIKISALVGQQKSSGLEVMSNFKPYKTSWYSGPSPAIGSPTLGNSVISERIGFSFLSDVDCGVVFYCPQKYSRSDTEPVSIGRPDYQQKPFTWMRRAAVANTSSLVIRITRTSHSSVPAIGRIDVWGEPSSCLPKDKADEIIQQWKASRSKLVDIPFRVSDATSCIKKKPDTGDCIPGVPEEFLDAITYEVMALPMVLPSGKVVDQSTLEQHANSEANWGREPSDPFTGLPFTKSCRPILDASLRTRIDKFLIDNQHQMHLKNVPRTVGRAKLSVNPQSIVGMNKTVSVNNSNTKESDRKMPVGIDITKCKWNNAFRGVKKLPSKRHVPVSTSFLREPNSSNIFSHKKMNLGSSGSVATQSKQEYSQLNYQSIEISDNSFSMQKKENSKNVIPSTSSYMLDDDIIILDSSSPVKKVTESKPAVCHERRLDESLDSAVKAALQGKPSFTQVRASMPKPVYIQCGSCKVEDNLFKLPCKHFLCRKCLLSLTQEKNSKSVCGVCNVVFNSSEPQRFHI